MFKSCPGCDEARGRTLCRTTLGLSVQLFYAARILFLHTTEKKLSEERVAVVHCCYKQQRQERPNFSESPEDRDCKETKRAGFGIERDRESGRKRVAGRRNRSYVASPVSTDVSTSVVTGFSSGSTA